MNLLGSCPTCEVLKEQLAYANRDRERLLDLLIKKNEPEPVEINKEPVKPILPRHIPWHVRQQMLEAEDREKARIIKAKQEEIEDLEKEVLKPVAGI